MLPVSAAVLILGRYRTDSPVLNSLFFLAHFISECGVDISGISRLFLSWWWVFLFRALMLRGTASCY